MKYYIIVDEDSKAIGIDFIPLFLTKEYSKEWEATLNRSGIKTKIIEKEIDLDSVQI